MMKFGADGQLIYDEPKVKSEKTGKRTPEERAELMRDAANARRSLHEAEDRQSRRSGNVTMPRRGGSGYGGPYGVEGESNRHLSGNDLKARESATIGGFHIDFGKPNWQEIGHGGPQSRSGKGITQKTKSVGTYDEFPKLGGDHPDTGITKRGNAYVLVHTGDDNYSRMTKHISAQMARSIMANDSSIKFHPEGSRRPAPLTGRKYEPGM